MSWFFLIGRPRMNYAVIAALIAVGVTGPDSEIGAILDRLFPILSGAFDYTMTVLGTAFHLVLALVAIAL
jgi:hypothetical protein